MKNIALSFFLLISITAYSQEQFFVGKDAELLIGKKVTVKEGISFYSGFYHDSNLKKLLYKDKSGVGNDPAKLIGLEFIVTKSMVNPNKYNLGQDLVLVLENDKTGIIYYAYDPQVADLFLLNVVGGLMPPEGFLCQRLITEKDKFSSKITTRTPTEYEYSITRIEENGEKIIYLRLQSYGATLNINEKGLKVLFSDGTVISKPDEEINYTDASGTKGWTYSCFVRLDKEDINTFTIKTITDYSLGIYERKIKSTNALELREYLKCMIK